MNKKLAKIRPYYKYETAQLFGISKRTFMDWIEDIEDELESTGHFKAQQIFTLKQTEIIFDWLGHPPALNETDIHSNQRALIIPYSKSELADLYGFSGRTLLAQIESIPNRLIKLVIMNANNKGFLVRQYDKKLFRKKEVKLIFEYLGHPFI